MPLRSLGLLSVSVNARLRAGFGIALLLAGCSKPASLPPPIPPPPISVTALAESTAAVADLEHEFATATEPARRIEILYEIALQPAPSAVDVLRKIRAGTNDAELREHITRSLAFAFAANPDATLAFFRELLAPGPIEARAIAAETLRDIESPAALPLWRDLEKDPEPDLQETARAAVEYLTSRFPGR